MHTWKGANSFRCIREPFDGKMGNPSHFHVRPRRVGKERKKTNKKDRKKGFNMRKSRGIGTLRAREQRESSNNQAPSSKFQIPKKLQTSTPKRSKARTKSNN